MGGGCPIFTYHSQLIFGTDYHDNSHVALESDLAMLTRSGRRIVSLRDLVADWIAGQSIDFSELACITFDDGPDFDWHDHAHPAFGPQPAFATLLRRHAALTGGWAGATSFVIACAQARRKIGLRELGMDAMHDDWWREASRDGTLSIESHGWDHRHPAADPSAPGTFIDVRDEASCRRQVDAASHRIARVAGRRPRLFAYPYGEASEFLRDIYLPVNQGRHGLMAACGTRAGMMHPGAARWDLPRYVHCTHWTRPEEFAALLRS